MTDRPTICDGCTYKRGLAHLPDGTVMCLQRTWNVMGGFLTKARAAGAGSMTRSNVDFDQPTNGNCPDFKAKEEQHG
jgi:hypothetical protein